MKKELDFIAAGKYNEIDMKGKKKKPKMGRPPKPLAERHSARAQVWITEAERKYLDSEAKKRGISISALLMLPWRRKGIK